MRMEDKPNTTDQEARRQFLTAAGKLAIGAPPAVTLLLASKGALAKTSSGDKGSGKEKAKKKPKKK
jgi:hypothetical protein